MRHMTIIRQIEAVARFGSIRKAAEHLAIAPSALNRRVQAFERELGEQVFERLPRGVRLNPAGELLLHMGRRHVADLERVRGQIADLSGVRRGHVPLACSQALNPYFLPAQIARYVAQHPAVTFDVTVADRGEGERMLLDYAVDLALVVGPISRVEVDAVIAVPQTLHVVMAQAHPLAGDGPLRLRDCLRWPLALPSEAFGGRRLLERAAARLSHALRPACVSNAFEFLMAYAAEGEALTFQLSVGAPEGLRRGLVSRPLDRRDVPEGALVACQLRGRTLPVASARFLDQLARDLSARFEPA